ncbi:MAG: hypothetical protein AM326_08895 [Candidatus Thorarchaeota archaeon SMTZ-45]|nr:MAG: hypothetical protein AM325_07030 [Candidatus Thorarchaeota archaeon SMTZ1-45]KXH75552.1 MAG: hypothetical protein AM326_08895 [Candidatus Thorarchaeota archaeon SMTZ-45]
MINVPKRAPAVSRVLRIPKARPLFDSAACPATIASLGGPRILPRRSIDFQNISCNLEDSRAANTKPIRENIDREYPSVMNAFLFPVRSEA